MLLLTIAGQYDTERLTVIGQIVYTPQYMSLLWNITCRRAGPGALMCE